MRLKILEVLIKAILRQRRCDVIISHGRVSTNLIMLLYFNLPKSQIHMSQSHTKLYTIKWSTNPKYKLQLS